MKRFPLAWMGMLSIVCCGMPILAPTPVRSQDFCTKVRWNSPSLYERQDDLPATLLATRQKYRAWLADQPSVRQHVQLEAWWSTPPLPETAAKSVRLTGPAVEREARLGDGRPLWSRRENLPDGKAVSFVSGGSGNSIFLARLVTTNQPRRLTVGLGGGDHLEVLLNGQRIATAETRLESGRYGCATRVDGTRVDQMLVDLDLDEGENWLVLKLVVGSEPTFYFSLSPNPVPRIWERIRDDFPASQNPILDLVHANWFSPDGWLSTREHDLEESYLEDALEGCGPDRNLIRKELERLRQAESAGTDRNWLDLCVKVSMISSLRRHWLQLRAAVGELGVVHHGDYPAEELLKELDDFSGQLSRLAQTTLQPDDAQTQQLVAAMPAMKQRMLVALNPSLADAEILFVKRYTYNSKHYYDDFQHIRRWGGNLCVLSLATGKTRDLVPELADGVFDRYDLSFNAQRVIFGHRRPQPEGFRIYETRVDGTGLRQVTRPPHDEEARIASYGVTSTGDSFYGLLGYRFWTDDVHPCYLPDGDICFASTRCEHGVLCTPNHYLACTNLFRMRPDGSGIRPLSQGALSEFTPTVMSDGRILYNRWEYVYKGIAAVQPLWRMRPDGSGSEEFYGDNVTNPGVLWQARQVPGHPHLAVCIGCGHEPLGVGQVLLLDLRKNKRTPEPMISLTPHVRTENLRGLYQRRNGVWREDIYGPFYADPFPLSDKFFLVSCNPTARYNDPSAYQIHLLDVFGNRVPIYADDEFSCWQPMLLQRREVPPVLPSLDHAPTGSQREEPESTPEEITQSPSSVVTDEEATATVFLSDVYRGLPGVERGVVKYLRVMEQIPKPWAAEVDPLRGEDRRADGFGGHIAVSHNAHIWVAVLRGVVPVEEDGSACFEVPARRNLFFQALDEDFMEVQRMRTFVNFEPGESRSCIGCHEHRIQAPLSRTALAFGKEPAQLAAQPGDVAPRPLYYPTDVQPIFDQHCVSCHDGSKDAAAPDLRGEMTTYFSRSYENLLTSEMVDTIREWAGAVYSMQHAEAVAPYSHGSHRSKLVATLKADHYDADLSREEWVKLVTWIDCGAPFYGSYYGRRNLNYRGQPDFRPVPTLESACGIAPTYPELESLEPLPAELLARWSRERPDSQNESTATLRSECRGVRVIEDPVRGSVLQLDGNSSLAAGGLGRVDAVSVSVWVRPETLPNQWNAVLFTDNGNSGAFHFSVRSDGVPNVAINTGATQWTHRGALTPVEAGRWHHVVVTCDPRFGGRIVFYLDGKQDARHGLSLGIPLDLEAFRVGIWNNWDNSSGRGFRGALADLRVYRGTLTEEQVAAVYSERVSKYGSGTARAVR
jgi:hypothetical protein